MDTVIVPNNKAFFSAVQENDRRALMELVSSSHVDPRFIKNEKQETLLHFATKLGFIDMVRVLVEIYQLCPFEVDRCSNTSVHYACQYNHLFILCYFFRLGGYAHISDLHHGNNQIMVPKDFESRLLLVAVSSGSVAILRCAYALLTFNQLQCLIDVKPNFFLDTFRMLSKVIDPTGEFVAKSNIAALLHTYTHRGNLNFFKFAFEELADPCSPLLSQIKEYIRWGHTMQFQDACKVDDLDNAICKNYLTKTRGFSLACEPSTYSIQLTSPEPFNHVQCFKHLYSPLHTAVLCGNISTVQALMIPTGNLFHVRHYLITKHGTLLHSACVSGSQEMVEMMIQEFNFGRDINVKNNYGNTALHVACEWGWLEIVRYLCECNDCDVNINITNCNGYSPFTLAIKHNRLDIFRYLLTLHTVDVNMQSIDTLETPLHLACCCESPGFASALLDDIRYTTSLDAVDKFGDTPLFNACRVGSIAVIRKLIAKPECNRLYVNHITKETPAHIICRKNQLDILKLILSEGISDPFKGTQFNCLGKSLLHIACDNDSEEIVDFLIDNAMSEEFNPNIPGVLMSPVHIACAHDNVKILMKLISSQICKTTDKDADGNNIFHYICTREQISSEMMEVFSTNEVSKELIMQSNREGKNPLHFVCENDAVQVLDCFIRQLNIMLEQVNAALCSTDNAGSTPLHTCLIQKSTLVLRYLLNTPELAGGISKALCTQDSFSCSPLHLVCYKLQVDYAQFIVSSPYLSEESIRVAVCLVDQEGNNVFHVIFAYYCNYERFIQMFEILIQLAGCKLNDDVFVQALCMHNKIRYTPLLYALNKRITDKTLCCILSLLVKSKLSIESVKTICSTP
jgi:ankyrin repeat protein